MELEVVMIGIYKIQNTINGKYYIGASKDIDRRWNEHKNCKNEDSLLSKAIKKHGLDNFSFEIIEECCPDTIYTREIYWINYYNSFRQGYNLNVGGVGGGAPGEVNGRSILKEEEVIFIRNAYKNNESKIETFKKYFLNKITFSGFCSIWQGYNWKHIMPEIYTKENKEKHIHRSLKGKVNTGQKNNKAKLTEEDVLEIITLLTSSKITQIEIAKKYNVSENMISLINRCKNWTYLHTYQKNIRLEGSNQ